MRTRSDLIWLLGLLVAITAANPGCSPTQQSTTSTPIANEPPADAEDASVAKVAGVPIHPSVSAIFEPPVRLKAGDDFVAVEAPGYACPTMADVDGDGLEDLVVGQFRNGNLQYCKNTASSGQPPQLAQAEWLKTGNERATVPGVW